MTNTRGTQQPTILWISGAPGHGKTTLAGLFGAAFSTDEMICRLPEWCNCKVLLDAWPDYGHRKIGAFLDWTVAEHRWHSVAAEILTRVDIRADLTVIEGYMPTMIASAVLDVLESRGYRTWLAVRADKYSVEGRR